MTVDVQDSAGYHHGLALFLYAVVIERMKKMNIEINGVTLQADFMDADFMEVVKVMLTVSNLPKTGSPTAWRVPEALIFCPPSPVKSLTSFDTVN